MNSRAPNIAPVAISPVEEIVADMRAGRIVILVDEEDRENEGDLVLAAEHVTPEAINFMARFGRGLICLTLTRDRCQQLNLPPMVARNGDKKGTAFTVSIEAAEGVTTGISAADRARTVQAAVAKNASASDLVQPGHIFPLQAVDGGVLMRAGHTEAGCDLAAMAGGASLRFQGPAQLNAGEIFAVQVIMQSSQPVFSVLGGAPDVVMSDMPAGVGRLSRPVTYFDP